MPRASDVLTENLTGARDHSSSGERPPFRIEADTSVVGQWQQPVPLVAGRVLSAREALRKGHAGEFSPASDRVDVDKPRSCWGVAGRQMQKFAPFTGVVLVALMGPFVYPLLHMTYVEGLVDLLPLGNEAEVAFVDVGAIHPSDTSVSWLS
eukprot:SAG31_NODE_2252_length_6076_cov_2.828342_3_plen_151_part_00